VRTVMALDERPNGFYSVDFREDEFGYPCPTEVNAGRCFTTSYLSTAAGVNFMDLWCRMLNDKLYFEPINKLIDRIYDCLPAGLTWMRHIDCPELLLDAEGKVLHGGSPLTWVAG